MKQFSLMLVIAITLSSCTGSCSRSGRRTVESSLVRFRVMEALYLPISHRYTEANQFIIIKSLDSAYREGDVYKDEDDKVFIVQQRMDWPVKHYDLPYTEYHFNVDTAGYDMFNEDMKFIGRLRYGINPGLDSLVNADNL